MSPFDTFIKNVQTEILDPLITVVALAAFIIFAWGIVEFIRGADNEESRKQGQQHIFWGIIGLVIIFGAVAIVKILKGFIGV